MNNRYRGRRRRRGINPLAIGLCVAVVAVILLAVNIIMDRHKKPQQDPEPSGPVEPVEPVDPTPVDDPETPEDPVDPTPTDDPETPEDPVDPTPTDDPVGPATYEPIELTGEQQQYESVYRIGNTGFEMYTYVPETAERYAAAVNEAARQMQGTADVYVITVPLSSGVTMPDELLGTSLFGDQKKAESKVVSMLGDGIKAVPLYDTLMSHRTEYIYFRTDHHWTALGAYYGYRAFCQAKGITPHELTDYWIEEFPGFLGTFYKDSGGNGEMGANPDTVVAYHPVTTTARLVFTDQNGQETPWKIIFPVGDWRADMKYNTFIGGDNPYTVITNPEVEDESACVVVKESFGNAFVPYLADHYHTVYVLDYRYWTGNLQTFVRESGAEDVVFVNNLSALRNSFLMGKLRGIID